MTEVESRLKLVQSIAKIGCWTWDLKSGRVTWSDQVHELYKCYDQVPSIELVKSFVHPDDVGPWERAIEGALHDKKPFSFDYRAIREDGKTVWLHNESLCILDERGELTGYHGTIQDITERKLAEETIRESEDRYRSVIESTMDALLLTAPDGRILSANQAACRLLGYSEQELIRVGRKGVVDETDPRLGPAFDERTQTGRFRGELTFLRRDGTRFPVEISSSVFTTQHGEQRTSMIVRDITERKKAEEVSVETTQHLRMMAIELANAEDRERRRISDYIHDQIGQSLAAIRLKLNTWKRMKSSPERRTLLADIERLLDTTIETTRTLTFELSPPILYSLGLGSAIEWLGEHLLEREGINFEFHDDGCCPAFQETCLNTLYHVVRELFMNVIKHAQAKRVVAMLSVENNILRIHVIDDGIGIDSKRCEKSLAGVTGTYGLFRAHERLLPINGTLDIVSTSGRGTRISLKVPIPIQGNY